VINVLRDNQQKEEIKLSRVIRGDIFHSDPCLPSSKGVISRKRQEHERNQNLSSCNAGGPIIDSWKD
jgi:hypothetical protein